MALRASSRSRTESSARVGTTRSIPSRTTCTRGRDVTSRAFPSFSTRQIEPVSATAKFAPGDADVGGLEHLAHPRARDARQLGQLRGDLAPLELREERGHVGGGLLDRRGDDVHRVLARKLEDPLAEIGLDDLHPRGLERLVEADLLGRHRLRLGDELRAHRGADPGDRRARLGGVGAAVDAAAAGLERVLEVVEVGVERRERAQADLAASLPQCLDVLERRPMPRASCRTGGRSPRRARARRGRRRARPARCRGSGRAAGRGSSDPPREHGREVDDTRAAGLLRPAAQVGDAARIGGD